MFIGCCLSFYPITQAVNECELSVLIYCSGAKGMANLCAKLKAKAF